MLLQPVKKEMLFVTRILAFVASNPLGPMTWSLRGFHHLDDLEESSVSTHRKYDAPREHRQRPVRRLVRPSLHERR